MQGSSLPSHHASWPHYSGLVWSGLVWSGLVCLMDRSMDAGYEDVDGFGAVASCLENLKVGPIKGAVTAGRWMS